MQNPCLSLHLRGRVSARAICSPQTAAWLAVCRRDETLARKMPFRTCKFLRSLVSLQFSASTVLHWMLANRADKVSPQLPAKASISRKKPCFGCKCCSEKALQKDSAASILLLAPPNHVSVSPVQHSWEEGSKGTVLAVGQAEALLLYLSCNQNMLQCLKLFSRKGD